ncbi:MAG: DUF1905 domain-containing protein [Acidobacteria bacterium]|nr:DUF1905 domain-containing protein [Acidobacteriota bacterium]
MPLDFAFRARLWLYEGAGAWHFLTLPAAAAARVHSAAAGKSKTWGSVRVTATIGMTRWKTSIFRDRKHDSYLLPVKASVRAKEHLRAGDTVEIAVVAEVDGD